jgi:hypothetical protein
MTSNPVAAAKVLSFLSALNSSGSVEVVPGPYEEHIRAIAPIGLWRQTLRADFRIIAVVTTNERTVHLHRALSYSLPKGIAEAVHIVRHLVDVIPSPQYMLKSKKLAPLSGNDPVLLANPYVTPSRIASYYKMGSYPDDLQASVDASQQIITLNTGGYPLNYLSKGDLAYFQSYYNIPPDPVDVTLNGHVFSGYCQEGNTYTCFEPNLDTQVR